ncbi:protein YIPF1 homolog [Helianthus annuus]|uniref:protein YIPF1 homolog n=1 Tax=Helianthus annuus TaxID=4232 RepID=UPI00165325B0|nr:protein YIPF1 homolog [Helianthus annuus]
MHPDLFHLYKIRPDKSPSNSAVDMVLYNHNYSALQTFPPSAQEGKIAGGSGPPRDVDVTSCCRYGPFWICTTLIFVSASIGTSITYLADKIRHKEWDYDIHMLTWSACVLYGYVVIVPITLYIVLKYLSVPLGLVQLLCLYGYSLFVFIPAGCLSIVPVEMFRWVVVGVAGFMSAMFVASNLRSHIVSAGERWFWIVSGITLLQLALSIVLKIYLFSVST